MLLYACINVVHVRLHIAHQSINQSINLNTFIRQLGRDRQRNTERYNIRPYQTHSRRTGTANY